MHKAGFVNIVGRPNVGKSTLMNQLVGERLSIITSKAQTTRQRILGIVNGDDFQVVFSDTPGIVRNPASQLHQVMNSMISTSLEDADVLLFMTEIYETPEQLKEELEKLRGLSIPKILILNKIDQAEAETIVELLQSWSDVSLFDEYFPISALKGNGVPELFNRILELLPQHPPYFDKEALTDRPERFFVSEIIREKIFRNYKKEVPYATEVGIDSFKEEDKLIRIHANIFVERQSQKPIIIGKDGSAIKKVGIQARKDIETFLGKQVYLELFVKVKEKWRDNPNILRNFGYES